MCSFSGFLNVSETFGSAVVCWDKVPLRKPHRKQQINAAKLGVLDTISFDEVIASIVRYGRGDHARRSAPHLVHSDQMKVDDI